MIKNVIAAAEADLDVCWYMFNPGETAINYGFGWTELKRNDTAPPRVIFVPDDERYDWNVVTKSSSNPRALCTSKFGFQVHCWGESYEQTETLRSFVIACLARNGKSSFDLSRGQWNSPEWLTRGYLFTIYITWYVPIPDMPDPTALILSTIPDTSSAGEGNLYDGTSTS